MKHRSLASLGAFGIMMTAPIALAGDLNPPPGAIQPTNRVTLNQKSVSLPLTINNPGSYIFTSDIKGVSGQNGIIIDSDEVTIDFNGFTLRGVPGSLDGIVTSAATADRITIRNGTIHGWGDEGIEATGIFSEDWLIEDVKVVDNGGNGMLLSSGCVIKDCIASGNGGSGIAASGGDGTIVENCLGKNNGGDGISARGVVRGSAAFENGFHGISGTRGLIETSVAKGNAQTGIVMTRGSVIKCTTSENDVQGISVSEGIIKDCNSTLDHNGIKGNGNTRIESNHVTSATLVSITTASAGNIVLRNTVTNSGIADYQIFAGNSGGPVVNVVGVTDISTIPAASHPWANFIN